MKVKNSIKWVKYHVYFNKDECDAKCMYGQFETQVILCKHILAICSLSDVQKLPFKYIMDRWRKDIKCGYALIWNSYDDLSITPATSKYGSLIKLCYKVATNASESDYNTLDMEQKLQVMNLIYTKKPLPALVKNNVDLNDVAIETSKKVLSPHVVRGKWKLPSKMSRLISIVIYFLPFLHLFHSVFLHIFLFGYR